MSELYIPPGCTTLDKIEDSQIRVGIQGPPFSGKTTAALTFPNPVAASFDKKVTAHKHNPNTIIVPFWDAAFIDKLVRRDGYQALPNKKEALPLWLTTEGSKLSSSQTLIVDGSTAIEEAYHIWFRRNEISLASTQGGHINEFIEWRMKNEYFGEVFDCLKTLKCNVVYICHEVPDRDKKGELNGKIRPLLSGQFGDKLGGNLTDFFRAIVVSKPKDKEQEKKLKDWAKIDDTTLQEWINSSPSDYQSIHLWQTQEDELCDCGTSSMTGAPKYILAHYNSFSKYQNKKQTT